MTKPLPWSLTGVGSGARETAREAARRDGKSLGEWLDRIITKHTARLDAADDDTGGSGFCHRAAGRQNRPAASGRAAVPAQARSVEPNEEGYILRPRFIRPRSGETARKETCMRNLREPGQSVPRFAVSRSSHRASPHEDAALLLLAEAAANMGRRVGQTRDRAAMDGGQHLKARVDSLRGLVEAARGTVKLQDEIQKFRSGPGPRTVKGQLDFSSVQSRMPRRDLDGARDAPPASSGNLNEMIAELGKQMGLAGEAFSAISKIAHAIELNGDRPDGAEVAMREIAVMQRYQTASGERTQAALTAIYEILEGMTGSLPAADDRSADEDRSHFRPGRRH